MRNGKVRMREVRLVDSLVEVSLRQPLLHNLALTS